MREMLVLGTFRLDGVVTVDAVNGRATLDAQPEAVKRGGSGMSPGSVLLVTCPSGCRRHGAAALIAGRVTDRFGSLAPHAATAQALLDAAAAHAAAPDGWLPRAERRASLQFNILARIPPLHWLPSAIDGPIGWLSTPTEISPKAPR